MKNKTYMSVSATLFFFGLLCWIPNLFFYNPNNPPMFIFLTPFIGGAGALLALKVDNQVIMGFLMFFNMVVCLSLGLVFFIGTLLWGP
ncbi:MAG: hypothetical protein RR470_04145 [Vagococcus sp.]|uniref:hypothetical protein n=1 Tax=Vagococcus sp. TaxID=1933889 RepID=UPI002FC7768F